MTLKAVGPHRIDPSKIDAILHRDKGAVLCLSNGDTVLCEGLSVEDVEKTLGVAPAKASGKGTKSTGAD